MIADLKPYAEYKESGLPWLGQVPAHWDVQKPRHIGSLLKGVGGTKEDALSTGIPCVRYGELYTTHTFFVWEPKAFIHPDRASNYTPLHYGDVLFAASGESLEEIGKSAVNLIEGAAVCGGDVIILRPTVPVHAPFLGYVMDCRPSANQKATMGRGTTVKHIYPDELKHLLFPFPPVPEQAAIVRFLDWANGRLERAIRAKRKVIALLNEQKRAIIHRAVTRGLDPSVPLKPSGIPWLGDIPQHWEVHQLRRLVRAGRRITYGIVQPGEPDPKGRYMVRGQDYSYGWAPPATLFRVSRAVEVPYSRSRLAVGDLVLTIVGAGVGNVAVVPDWLDGANITQTTARISIDPTKAHAGYVGLVLQGPLGKRNVERYVKGAAQPGLNLEHVRIFLLPMPDPSEQASIYSALQRELSSFTVALSRLKREIELLREYRTRLVADLVTGKLDVREAAARLPDAGRAETVAGDIKMGDESEIADEEVVV